MKVGDIVRVKVVGLGALRRAFHDAPATVLATHSAQGRPLDRWRVLWEGRETTIDPALLVPDPHSER